MAGIIQLFLINDNPNGMTLSFIFWLKYEYKLSVYIATLVRGNIWGVAYTNLDKTVTCCWGVGLHCQVEESVYS